jgi:hypothetical protein
MNADTVKASSSSASPAMTQQRVGARFPPLNCGGDGFLVRPAFAEGRVIYAELGQLGPVAGRAKHDGHDARNHVVGRVLVVDDGAAVGDPEGKREVWNVGH